MNMHPLLGQFPVGILILYVLIELFQRRFMYTSEFWFRVRGFLVISGTALAYLSMPFGEATKNTVLTARPSFDALIATYSTFAWISIITFTLLSAAYVVRLAVIYKYDDTPFFKKPEVQRLWKPTIKASDNLLKRVPSAFLALIGVITLVITISLNASIIYGGNIDPVVGYIYDTLKGLFF